MGEGFVVVLSTQRIRSLREVFRGFPSVLGGLWVSVIWDCVPGHEHGREQKWHVKEEKR